LSTACNSLWISDTASKHCPISFTSTVEVIFLKAFEYCLQFLLDIRYCFKTLFLQFHFQFGNQSNPKDRSLVLVSLLL
jgi:hypothetical protein